jgi:hypothetical protein
MRLRIFALVCLLAMVAGTGNREYSARMDGYLVPQMDEGWPLAFTFLAQALQP